MFGLKHTCTVNFDEDYRPLEEYHGGMPRWCAGCGDNSILTAVQKLLRDEQLAPEKTVFVSGIGCAARFPHYINAYGYHGLHGRALPTAEGIKIRRPDLHVFVNMGDGDCCSIGTAHWIHAIRMNMNLTVMMHDNGIYALTKKQVSPTTPRGMRTRTTPYGAHLDPINPLSATLGVSNVSFVAQVVEWMPELLADVIDAAYHHKGFSFIRILQRCPHFTSDLFAELMANPDNILVLEHDDGIRLSEAAGRMFKTREEFDPSNIHRAREVAELTDKVPVGILYRNEDVPIYEEIRRPKQTPGWENIHGALEKAFDNHAVVRDGTEVTTGGKGDGIRVVNP